MFGELPTVAVVIPTAGERPDSLGRLLDAVLLDPGASEVIVVVDRESPSTERLVEFRAKSDSRVELVPTHPPAYPERDRGQASRDVGFRAASADVLLSLDDDLEPEPAIVSAHARWHRDQPGLVVLGYTPVVAAESGPDNSQGAMRLYSESYERACDRFRDGSADVLMGLWGGHFSVRRKDWIEAERLAETNGRAAKRIGAHHIDTALGFRLREKGLAGVFDPQLVAAHRYGLALRQVSAAAHSVGFGRTLLHTAYADLVPPPEASVKNWRALRVARWLSRSEILTGFARGAVLALGVAAARLRLGEIELVAARLLSAMGYARGVRDARADLSRRE